MSEELRRGIPKAIVIGEIKFTAEENKKMMKLLKKY